MPPPLWQDSLLVLARHRSLTAICALALLVAITGTMFLVSSQNSPRLLANSCSASRCHRLAIRVDPSKSDPAGGSGPPVNGRSHRKHAHGRKRPASPSPSPSAGHGPTPHPTRSPHSPKPKKSPKSPHPTTTPTGKPTKTPSPSPTPTSAPTPTPTGTPDPSVSYTVVHRWWGGFQGEFTIVNKGTAPINGWELRADLPFDHIDSVWDAVFHTDGHTLVLDPPSYQATIPPGGSLTEDFTAKGGWTNPTSCTFNGSPC
jgi:hypothetical protein